MKYTLRDAGETMTHMIDGPNKQEKYYPQVSFDIKQLPEIGTWEVGKEYTIVLKVREKEHVIAESSDENGGQENARFEILKVGAYKEEEDEYGEDVKKKMGIRTIVT